MIREICADYDHTVTLPNHTSLLTGRPVDNKFEDASSGHLWTENYEVSPEITLHSNRGFYVSSTFDVAPDHGRFTALYSGKPQFALSENSYDAAHGAEDVIGDDDGRNKIDLTRLTDFDSGALMASFLADMQAAPANFTFLHFPDPDSAGHGDGWGGAAYLDAIKSVDVYLASIFDLVALQPQMAGRTAIVPTADPGIDRPDFSTEIPPPIRKGDSGNLALSLLGLGLIPGSSIDSNQNLVAVPEPSVWGLVLGAALLTQAAPRRRP